MDGFLPDPPCSGPVRQRCFRACRKTAIRYDEDMSVPLRGHQRIDQRSLALHRAIAEKLRAHPELIEIACDNLDRWTRAGSRSQPYWDVWREILRRPLPEI